MLFAACSSILHLGLRVFHYIMLWGEGFESKPPIFAVLEAIHSLLELGNLRTA